MYHRTRGGRAEVDGAVAGPSSHYPQEHSSDDSGRDGVVPVLHENQLGEYPIEQEYPAYRSPERVVRRYPIWFRQLMESDSGKEKLLHFYFTDDWAEN